MKPTQRKPVLIEPENKYWRSKANSRVRKQRRVRNLARWSGILLANALIAGGLVWSGFTATRALLGGEEFAIARFRVEGVQRASSGAIHARLERVYEGRNLFSVNLFEIERVVRMDPWVHSAAVKRVLPDTIRVRLVERRPVAVAVIRGVAHLIDGGGYVIGPVGLAGGGDDLPVLTGLERFESEALIGALRRGVGMLERLNLRAPLFAHRLSELDLAHSSHVVVHTLDGGPPLYLDPANVERNVERWLDLAGAIRRRAGALEYVDLRWSHRIAVKPLHR